MRESCNSHYIAIKKYTKNGKFYLNKALSKDGDQRFHNKAIKQFILANKHAFLLSREPNLKERCLFNLGTSYIEAGYYDKGMQVMKNILDFTDDQIPNSYPCKGSVFFNIGLAYYNTDEYENAKKYFQKALKESKKNFDPSSDLILNEIQEHLKKIGEIQLDNTQAVVPYNTPIESSSTVHVGNADNARSIASNFNVSQQPLQITFLRNGDSIGMKVSHGGRDNSNEDIDAIVPSESNAVYQSRNELCDEHRVNNDRGYSSSSESSVSTGSSYDSSSFDQVHIGIYQSRKHSDGESNDLEQYTSTTDSTFSARSFCSPSSDEDPQDSVHRSEIGDRPQLVAEKRDGESSGSDDTSNQEVTSSCEDGEEDLSSPGQHAEGSQNSTQNGEDFGDRPQLVAEKRDGESSGSDDRINQKVTSPSEDLSSSGPHAEGSQNSTQNGEDFGESSRIADNPPNKAPSGEQEINSDKSKAELSPSKTCSIL